ncbi:hypothetical protein V2E24_02850 [Mycoplasmopsis ciconiae]|uniref:Lipoprotein n=1 Tax=Mycoplasmopsis ciconiae TaxID=561067 RepID=A0ABU7MLX8_9BACT|nr:hypothetical protein [Mycoplasmopsis ciconiae]
MKRIWKFLGLISSISFLPISLSCTYVGDLLSKNTYIKSYNSANLYQDTNYKFNYFKFIESDFDSLNFEGLFKYKFVDKIEYDFINKNTKTPTKKVAKLNLASAIKLYFDNDLTITYDNDDYDLNHKYNDNLSIVNAYSSNITSINNPDFKNNLNAANKIEIFIKKAPYVFVNNQKSTYTLEAQDFLVNIDNPEIKKLLDEYQIKIKNTSNSVILESNQKKYNYDFVFKVLSNNFIFNPVSNKYLEDQKIKFSEYNPTLKDRLSLNHYLLVLNDYEQQKYVKNSNFVDFNFSNSSEFISEIILNYKSIKLDEETFRLQLFKNFRQMLVSEADFDLFNTYQQQQILNNSKNYGLTFYTKTLTNKPLNKFVFATDFTDKKFDFNNTYARLIYQQNQQQLINTSLSYNDILNNSFAFLFLKYINNVFNFNAVFNYLNFQNYFYSQIYPFSIFESTQANKSNYLNVSDTLFWINNVDLNSFGDYKIKNNINIVDNKLSYTQISKNLDLAEQFKSYQYDFIKQNMKQLLDKFYENNKDLISTKIQFNIPVISQGNFYLQFIYQNWINLINSLDSRIQASFEFVNDVNLNDKNYIYNKYEISYFDNTLESFLKKLFEKITFNQIKQLANKYDYFNISEYIKKYNITSEKEFINNFNQNSVFNQSLILKDINNIYLIPFSEFIILDIGDFNKKIVQPHFNNPINDLGYTIFDDIKVN